jgi:hypothetical protein
MSEDQVLDWGVGAQAITYMVRATKDCTKRCGALKVDRDFNEAESECLSTHLSIHT